MGIQDENLKKETADVTFVWPKKAGEVPANEVQPEEKPAPAEAEPTQAEAEPAPADTESTQAEAEPAPAETEPTSAEAEPVAAEAVDSEKQTAEPEDQISGEKMEDPEKTEGQEKEKSETVSLSEENKEAKEDGLPPAPLPEPFSAFCNGISVFGFSQQGESHVKTGTPCQDRSGMRILNDRIVLCAVADGVGSCALSDYGAETAVNAGLDYLEQKLLVEMKQEDFHFDKPKKMSLYLREMMQFAYDQVEKKAEELEQPPYFFQSTLTVAAYDGTTLYFGHAGDDGIVALTKSGLCEMATNRHKGEEAGSVFPLQSKNTWQFGKVDDAVGFVLATDGVLDAFVRPEAEERRVYYPFIEPVFYTEQSSAEEAEEVCLDWYEYMKKAAYRNIVTDDISLVGVVNQQAVKNSVKPEFDIEEWNRKTTEYAARRRAALYPPEQKEKKDYAGRGYIKDDLAGNGRKDVRADGRTAGTSAEKSGTSGIFGTSGSTAERPAGDLRRPGSGGSAPGGKTTGGNSSAPGRTRNIPVYTPEQQREENRERMQALRENVEDIAYASASFGIGALGAVTSFVSKACDRKYDRMRDRKRQKNQREQEVRHDRKVQKHDQ